MQRVNMSEKNYYDILGVAKTASEDDIKKAYRKLVRQYHPDVSTDPDADKKMGEINNAYETLKDSQKRRQYDLMLDNPFVGQSGGFSGFGGFGNSHQMSQEELNDLLRQFGGAGFDSFSNHFGKQQEKSDNGSFSFEDIFQAFSGGRFQDNEPTTKGDDKHSDIVIDLQKSYDGGSQQFRLQTPVDGAYESKTIEVKIPQGILAGQKIRLAKQGNPSTSGGENGDLYLTVQFKADEKFHIQGKDVTQNIDVLPWEALFGATITVTTPVGKVNVSIPKYSKNGTKLRLKGKGIPAKEAGDLYLKLNIVLPDFANDEHRQEEQLQAWQFLQDTYDNVKLER